jgi:hypothetical protein
MQPAPLPTDRILLKSNHPMPRVIHHPSIGPPITHRIAIEKPMTLAPTTLKPHAFIP